MIDKREKAQELKEKGLNYEEIGRVLKVSRQRAWQLINDLSTPPLDEELDSNKSEK